MLIEIKNLNISAVVGIYPEEKAAARFLSVNIRYSYDAEEAQTKDEIEYAIDYDDIAKHINILVAEKEFNLIEHLAYFLHSKLKANYKFSSLEIEVRKPKAICTSEYVSATISD